MSDLKDIEHEKYKNNNKFYDLYTCECVRFMCVIDIEWLILHKCDIGQLFWLSKVFLFYLKAKTNGKRRICVKNPSIPL